MLVVIATVSVPLKNYWIEDISAFDLILYLMDNIENSEGMNSPDIDVSTEEMRCCRACLAVGSEAELVDYIDMRECYSTDCGSITLLESFNKCTSLNVIIEDNSMEGYPPCHYICGRCLLDLKQAYEFITRAQLNNQLLKVQYAHSKSTTKTDDELQGTKSEGESVRSQNFDIVFTVSENEEEEFGKEECTIANSSLNLINESNVPLNNKELSSTTLISVERVFYNERGGKLQAAAEVSKTNHKHSKITGEEYSNLDSALKAGFEFKCEFCTAIFDFQRDLLQHYEVDHAEKTLNFPCDLCKNRFVTKNALRLHRRQVHQKDEYTDCEHCGRTVLKTFYNVHLRRHQQQFLCSKCPKICASRYTLKKHMELHSEERDRNIECGDCGRRFYTLENLQLHQTIHISPEDRAIFECTVCSKTFLRKSNLGLHMQMHRGETMDCPHCNKQFVRRKDLEIHIRFHTGEFPYACTMCDRKFAIKGHLNYHEKRHLGVRYKCDECEKTFINLAGLRQHQFEHTGMPLTCNVCKRGFPTKFKVRRHLRTVHQHLFEKTGYTDALAKKYITIDTSSNKTDKKRIACESVLEDTIEMLEEHANDIPLNMLAA